MPAEEWTSTRVPTALPSPRTRPRRPRRPYAHRAHLRKGGTSSVIAFAAPYVRWPKIKLVVRVAFKTSIHASMLALVRCGRLDGTLLLLTWLGVRAYPAPRTVHLCRPPRRGSLGAGPATPGLSSDGGQDRRMEGHYPEPHRLRQRRHCTATKHLAAAAGQPDASRWQQDRGRCDFHALSTTKAKIPNSPGPPRQRLHHVVGPTSSSRPAPSSP